MKFRGIFQLLVVLGILILGGCTPGANHLRVLQSNYSYDQGNYLDATVGYLNSLNDAQYNQFVAYNLANVYYALGEFNPAISLWEQGSQTTNEDLLFRIQFNKGVLYYEQGDFQQARRSFIAALILQPGSIEAKMNLELTLDKLDSPLVPQSRRINQPEGETNSTIDAQTLRVFDYLRRKEGQQWTPAPLEESPSTVVDW